MYPVLYEDKYESEWDKFIQENAVNGTFLQTRNFLNYHPKERFIDNSILLFKENTLAAIVPGCAINDGGTKTFFSHAGSTFGGPVIHKKYYDAANIIEMIKSLENKLREEGFAKSILKITPDLFCKEKTDVLQYVLAYCGYSSYTELSTYIDFETYKQDISANFNQRQRRNLKNALKYDLQFKNLNDDKDIYQFYNILKKNLTKFNADPVHTIDELFDLKNNRLKKIVEFYGIYLDRQMIAATMIFSFDGILHTQYLASDYDYANYRPMTYLYYRLIEFAFQNGYKKLSWGVSTEKRGTVLNESLLSFKESFGSKYSLNRGFYKTF
jgi:lipid II:glycine glycyltransferase (peptidoglycan interpeptide bridge formation enzyme)